MGHAASRGGARFARAAETTMNSVLLADFGIARNVDDISGLTSTNMTVGTVANCARIS